MVKIRQGYLQDLGQIVNQDLLVLFLVLYNLILGIVGGISNHSNGQGPNTVPNRQLRIIAAFAFSLPLQVVQRPLGYTRARDPDVGKLMQAGQLPAPLTG